MVGVGVGGAAIGAAGGGLGDGMGVWTAARRPQDQDIDEGGGVFYGFCSPVAFIAWMANRVIILCADL